jgi:hypothetical protein
MRSPLRRRMLSSMPTRTRRPRAIPIVQSGITDRMIDSTNISEPCGRAASVFHQIERVGTIGTSADLHEVVDQRSPCRRRHGSGAPRSPLGQVSEHGVGLDLVGAQATVISTPVVRIAFA